MCDYYARNSTTIDQCGRYDTWNDNFIAGEMCCACGGGLIREINVPLIEPTCQDTVSTDERDRWYLDSYGDGCSWYDSKINSTFCGRFDTENFRANEMCCVCGGGFTPASLSLAAKYFGQDSLTGKYLPEDISITGYAVIAALALPSLVFFWITSPFLLIGYFYEVDFIKGQEKVIVESLKSELIPLSVALLMVILVSCVIIKTRNSRKGRDDYQVAQSN